MCWLLLAVPVRRVIMKLPSVSPQRRCIHLLPRNAVATSPDRCAPFLLRIALILYTNEHASKCNDVDDVPREGLRPTSSLRSKLTDWTGVKIISESNKKDSVHITEFVRMSLQYIELLIDLFGYKG